MAEEMPQADSTTPARDPVLTPNEQNLAVAFIQFIRHKVSANECSDDQIEALEVAVQCLESAFKLTDANYAFQTSKTLLEVFTAAEGLKQGEATLPEPTEAEMTKANVCKEDGNALMKDNKFDEAIQKYNEAIMLHRDPVYFCNRAAAYCRLEQYDLAIQDCRTALALDDKYSKAYGRMGLALSCQNRYAQAVEAYKKAIELDPTQETYKNNLKIAEEKMNDMQRQAQGNPLAGLMGGGAPDFGAMFNNPAMMQMANTLMQDPNLQNMMAGMMQGGGGLQSLIEAGAQMARQMQETNPEVVEQLRRQFEDQGGPPGGPPGAAP